MTSHRFIEESFPVKEVGLAAAREKSIRQGHISTLHIWWARRPLAASRATAYAALTSAPTTIEEWQQRRDLIIDLCQWSNSLNERLLEKARQDILQLNGGRPPRVLDSFAGGGSYPLEAMRLGCETYACDYNPVAVLILKATLEYPVRFGRPIPVQDEEARETNSLFGDMLPERAEVNPLLEAVKCWGTWILQEARKELAQFYPSDADGSNPVGYIWARTIPCQNPSCGIIVPLMRQFWLAKKDKKKVALHPSIVEGSVAFKIVGDGYETWPVGFDASRGTVVGAVVTCPCCGSVIDGKITRRLFQEGQAKQRMVALVLENPERLGKSYRVATQEDECIFHQAADPLKEKRERLMLEWGLDPIPDEPLAFMSGVFNVPLYGMDTWGALFNSRQQLALITFADKVRQAHTEMTKEGYDPEFSIAVSTYLAIIFDRLADKNSNLVIYHTIGEKVEHVFGRQALGMVWDYVEVNPFTHVGWPNMQNWVELVLTHLSKIRPVEREGGKAIRTNPQLSSNANALSPMANSPSTYIPLVTQSSATALPYPDGFFDAVLTDPPYYNSVPYADLSDFFYVWLKRTIGH